MLLQLGAVRRYLSQHQSMEEVTCPTLVLAGSEDNFIRPEWSRSLHRRIDQSSYDEAAHAGHFLFLEKPKQTCERLVDFFRDWGDPRPFRANSVLTSV